MPYNRYYVKVRAYKVIDGEKVYGRYSKTGSATVKGSNRGFGFTSFPNYGYGFNTYDPWGFGYGFGYGYGYSLNPFVTSRNSFGYGLGYGFGYGRPHLAQNYYRPAMNPYFFYWF